MLRALEVLLSVATAVAIFYLWGLIGEGLAFVIALTAQTLYRRRAGASPRRG